MFIRVVLQRHCTLSACGVLVHFPFRCLLSNQNRKQHHQPLLGRPSGNQLSKLVMLLKQLNPAVSPVVLPKVNHWFLWYTMVLVRRFLSLQMTSLTRLWPAVRLPKRSQASLLPYSIQLSHPRIIAHWNHQYPRLTSFHTTPTQCG